MLKNGKILVFLVLVGFPLAVFGKTVPNDPLLQNAWWLDSIKAGIAWDKTTGNENVIVAVIDSSIDINHPDLKENIWENKKEKVNNIDDDGNGYIDDVSGWDFVDNDPVVSPVKIDSELKNDGAYHHGTLVSGIIGAVGNNGIGTAGVNWKMKIMPIRALENDGTGTIENVNKAIHYAIQNGASVINLSMVTDTFDRSFQVAVSDAYREGVVVVTALGNQGLEQVLTQRGSLAFGSNLRYPACFDAESNFPFVIGVGASDVEDKLGSFSNFGRCLDILAPGVKIGSTAVYSPEIGLTETTLSNISGTSLAAPFVSGAAALVKSIFPYLTHEGIMASILEGARGVQSKNPLIVQNLGLRVLDIAGALAKAEKILPKNLIYTLHSEGEKAAWQSFEKNLQKKWKYILPVEYSGILAWEVFDYDGDSVDEAVFLVNGASTGKLGSSFSSGAHIYIFDQKGIIEKKFKVSNGFEGAVKIIPISFDGDSSVSFGIIESRKNNVFGTLWKSNGKKWSEFAAKIKWNSKMENIDAYWDQQDQRIVIAEIKEKNVHVHYFDAIGVPFEEETHQLAAPAGGAGKIGRIKFLYRQISGNAARDALWFNMKGDEPYVAYSELQGEKKEKRIYPFSAGFKGGIDVSVGDWDHDGKFEIVAAPLAGAAPLVRIYNSEGVMEASFRPASISYRGGVQVRVTD